MPRGGIGSPRLLLAVALLRLGVGEAAAAPVVGVSPSTMPRVTLQQDGFATRTLTVRNDGDAALAFHLRIESTAEPEAAGGEVLVVEGPTPNDTDPTQDPSLRPYAEYVGDHLRFGITSYGEIVPYQYPVGSEHLRVGTYLAGYTLAYRIGVSERLAYAAFFAQYSLVPVSYEELENVASRLPVRVVTRTADGALRGMSR